MEPGPAHARARRRIAAACAALSIGLVAPLLAAPATAQTTPDEAAATLALVPHAPEPVREGAVLYDHACSACHGDTGGGLEEARLSFPESDRTCTTCHKPANPPQMDHLAMTWRNAFDVGVAPPLVGEEARLGRYGTGEALFGYIRATMPRPFPGSLDDEAYAKITAFLAAANGADVPAGAASVGELDALRLP